MCSPPTPSKPLEGDTHIGLPGGSEAESSDYEEFGDLEYWTKKINRMEPDDPASVCTSHSILPEYKSWVCDRIW